MPKKKITDLLSSELSDLQSLPEDSISSKQQEAAPPVITEIQSPKVTESETLEPSNSGTAKYLQLERKEVRLRLSQLDNLTVVTRKLNRARKGKGERLTENTLIRVAIDLLLENAEQLQGTTEEELLRSLGLPPRE
ncbi:hypothetical protein [Microcoleus sp. FACHB-1515]|uniref:hypothetical protein n=1 Tax=Cyanophyceae TaxID=3028117 RepID=UPI0018EFFF17|nr:hypothetical protein [Microcoleus sp. FACHB-1515]